MSRPLVFALALGCAGGGDDVNLDAGPSHTGDDEEDCLGADTFVAGIEKTSPAGRTVRIASAAPTPPDVGDNTWTVEVTDPSGPVEGLALAVAPWMPLHGHGLTPPTYTAVDDGGGSYTLQTFDLVMPGLWEFPVDVGTGSEPDEVVFKFCAEG